MRYVIMVICLIISLSDGAFAKQRRTKHKGTPLVTHITIQDDTGDSFDNSWKQQVDRFLAASRPVYGAFVAVEPETGKVTVVSEYSANPNKVPHPATASVFPAASIFKVITAAALLESGKVKPTTTVCYHGGSSRLDWSHIKDSKHDRACQSLSSAFARSTNAVFGKLAVRYLDPERLVAQAEKFLFNRKVLVDGMETESRVKRPSDELALARMAAGFINSTLSPLHAALIAATIATGGAIPPSVKIIGDDGSGGEDKAILQKQTSDELRKMMARTSTEGTGRRYFAALGERLGGPVAVKSGTLTSKDGSGLFNTWMVGFFPANRPEIAFAAVISTNGRQQVRAGHLTKFAIEAFLKLKRLRGGRS